MTNTALQALAQQGRVAPTQVAQRVIYAEVLITGQGATEATDERAAQETRDLFTYVSGIIE